MKAYRELMAKIHSVKIKAKPVNPRNFTLPHEFYIDNKLEYIERYLLETEFEDTNCFIMEIATMQIFYGMIIKYHVC
jgi:hypothetical protein